MTTLFTNATLLDATGAAPRPDMAVLVAEERIAWIGPASEAQPPEGARVIDLAGKTLMPGLTDVHMHITQGPEPDPLAEFTETVPFMALGADGVISVVANATPRAMAELVRAMACGDLPRARALHYRLADWMRVAFVESNPVPVKAALWMMGRIHPHVRLPLAPLAEANRKAVAEAVRGTSREP